MGALACVGCAAGRAGVIPDPQMGMEPSSASMPFNLPLTAITPGSGGGGVFDYYNATGLTITFVQFSVQLLPNLDAATVDSAFSCNEYDPTDPSISNPFFLFCGVGYTPDTGQLLITFSGTNAEAPGILPLLPGCSSTPDGPPADCTSQGHFILTLNDGYATSGDSGGWTSSTAAGAALFGTGVTPSITLMDIETAYTPEPATALSLCAGLLAAAGLGYKVRRRRR